MIDPGSKFHPPIIPVCAISSPHYSIDRVVELFSNVVPKQGSGDMIGLSIDMIDVEDKAWILWPIEFGADNTRRCRLGAVTINLEIDTLREVLGSTARVIKIDSFVPQDVCSGKDILRNDDRPAIVVFDKSIQCPITCITGAC